MIISHKHRFIFIKTRKTAGTSFEIALGDICGPEDVISRVSRKDEIIRRKSHRGAQNYRLSLSTYEGSDWKRLLTRGKIKRFRSHWTADQIKRTLSEDQWQSYFKFCFERNPWDKMVSHYFWKKEPYQLKDFEDFWIRGMKGEITGFHETLNAREQYSIKGQLAVDRVYQFEAMENALRDLSERFGLKKPLKLPDYKAKGSHRPEKAHYREVLSKAHAEQIGGICRPEIELLDYEF